MQRPRLYATFLLWLLSELFEELPEVGDLDKPKLVFFFDEAHLLFDDAPKALLDKVEQVVRLIRSKGVGVYFITQNPLDMPDDGAGPARQPGAARAARLHAARPEGGARPRPRPSAPTRSSTPQTAITELGVGEALVSILDDKGVPDAGRARFDRAAARPHRPGDATPSAPPIDQGKPARRQVRADGRSRIGLRDADRAVPTSGQVAHEDAAANAEPRPPRPVRCAPPPRRRAASRAVGPLAHPADGARARSAQAAKPRLREAAAPAPRRPPPHATCPRRRRRRSDTIGNDHRQVRDPHGRPTCGARGDQGRHEERRL